MKKPADLINKLKPITDVYMPKQKYDVAIQELLKLKERFSQYHVVDYYLGICNINLNAFEEGVHYLGNISNSQQLSIVQMVQTNMILGLIYTELGEYKNAEEYFQSAIKINPRSSMCHSALGYVYYLQKRYDHAISNFKKALQLDPNNASAHNNLGYTYAEINININEAVMECRKAIALNPSSAAYYDSLGWAYYASGQFGEAVKQLQKALELSPRNITIQEHLSKAIKKRDRSRQ
jgi:tetratricopeptide (TPR) repeat protein